MSKIVKNSGLVSGVLGALLVLGVVAGCTGCAGSQPEAETAGGEPVAPNYDAEGRGDYAPPAAEAPPLPQAASPRAGSPRAPSAEASPRGGGDVAKSRKSSADDYDGRSYEESAPSPGAYHRPGLATQWGEERESRIHETSFERQRSGSPFASVAIRYDDEDGVHALTGLDDRYAYPGVFTLAGGALTVSLVESDGDPWPALTSGGKHYVIGDEGDRYAIHVANHTPGRFEVVASVDGLDVIDGQDAQYGKRGYIVAPWGSLDIEGFRSSTQAVQAFRFGEVQDSYAVARGRGADVGVVGVAVFEERGFSVDTRRWNGDHEPNPFPGRFAPPPGY
jgi:hypothetical protein